MEFCERRRTKYLGSQSARQKNFGRVAELVYALVLGTNVARLGGSSPPSPTRKEQIYLLLWGIERIFVIERSEIENHLAT